MRRYVTFVNIIYILAMTIILNSYVLVKECLYTLLLLVPIFLMIISLAGILTIKTASKRLKVCNHGAVLIVIFCATVVPSFIYHIVLAFYTIPADYITFLISLGCCIFISSIVFSIGIICMYLTSVQMGIRWRLIGVICGLIPLVNLVVLSKILIIVTREVDYELEKERIINLEKGEEKCKTKYPILLVHGMFLRDYKMFNYWGRIPKTLEAHGARIFYGNHQSATSIEKSANELAARIKKIVEETGCEKLNIIAHSKGGLDCRYAISECGISEYVASLTTISTPHRGCVFAEKLLAAATKKFKRRVAKIYNTTLKTLGDTEPDFMAAANDLTNEACIKLNEKLTLPEGIYTQSIGSIMNRPRSGRFPLNLTYRYVADFDGENDGLVGENSFAWGEKYTLLRTSGRRGISHGDIIDLNRENIKDFDVRKFYVDLVHDLKEKEL